MMTVSALMLVQISLCILQLMNPRLIRIDHHELVEDFDHLTADRTNDVLQ